MNQVIHGDCLETLKTLEDNSIDSIVTDPPYGLSFMGKKWDYDVPSTEIWEECLRVLKPGGYLLAFAGTRTQHRMAVRIEDAGFEIRDMIAWVYGSGFPKSLNIGKAVDKLQGNERASYVDEAWLKRNPDNKLKETFNTYGVYNDGNEAAIRTKGTSPHEGWGTALKPALEPITVARKPIQGTVAENCLKWGVGGINIDECRVETNDEMKVTKHPARTAMAPGGGNRNNGETIIIPSPLGRFPANLIHDGSEEVVELFPNTKSGKMKQHIEGGTFNVFSKQYPRDVETIGDSGSASRFFKQCNFSQEDLCLQNQSQNNVKCAEIDLDYQDKLTVQEPVRIKSLDFKNEELPASQDFTGNLENSSQTQNHVSNVENQENTDTTQITQNSTRSSGCVHLATEENTKQENLNFANGQVQGTRFLYQAKASKKERNKGLDGTLTVKYNECISNNKNLCKEENMVAVQLLRKVISEQELVSFSTGESGESIMVQCQSGSLSTILTETRRIIGLKIYSSLMLSLTSEYTQDANSEMESGGSLAENVADLRRWILTTTNGQMELALGASRVALRMLSMISEEENWKPATNFHSTVKPIALMEYLVKLVSREGATVLDPFAGSGTTGIACKNLNRQFIGIEKEADYVKIANARMANSL